jgi:transposase
MTHDNYIKELINLQDNSLEVLNAETISNTIHINVFKPMERSNKECIFCGSSHIFIKSYHIRKIKFLKIACFSSLLIYKQRRFICKDCGKTFNEDCSLVIKNGTISNLTKQAILEECRKKQSATDISDRYDVSTTTVNSEFIQNVLNNRHPLTSVICIDEFKASTICGTYALIIGYPVSGDIIDILPSRKQDYIYYYFQQIPDLERFSVKYFVTDLFESYRSIARNLFCKSIHIA